MSVEPLISVVIPVHNGAAFLSDALGSIAAQTHRRLDIVVVDDGSTDQSAAMIAWWAARDTRVHAIATRHRGAEHARNTGVAAARGDFIAHLDQDDIAVPARLSTQYRWMQARGVDVCGSCTRVFGEHRYVRWVPERHPDIQREFVFRPAMIHSTTLLPAAIAKTHSFCEDTQYGGYDLLTRLALRYRLGNVPKVLVKYRRHAAQRSQVKADVVRADGGLIRRRYFFALFPAATPADYSAVMCLVDGVPFSGAAQMDLAAAWMRRLSDTGDPHLRSLMSDRWSAACACWNSE